MADGVAIERPVLWGQVGPAVSFSRTVRGSKKVDLPNRGRQGSRLGSRFDGLDAAFDEQAQITQSLGSSEPQLVIVFEAVDEREDLSGVAVRAGLEILAEVERDFDPDPDFPRRSVNKSLPVSGCLHAVCVNEQAKANVLSQWRKWQQTGSVDRGYAPLKNLFAHLKDVRAWGPQDRVRAEQVGEVLAGLLPGNHTVEIEFWYRRSDAVRQRAQQEVTSLVTAAGGAVLSTAEVAEIGYHGLKCTVPLDLLQRLAAGDFDQVALVRSAHVMYLRVTGQVLLPSEEATPEELNDGSLPSGDPVLCVLDGLPVANHQRLAGRVIVHDPDDYEGTVASQVDLRKHGTAMASGAVWGDISAGDPPASRPVLVRPILAPAFDTVGSVEEIRPTDLTPDLMRRVFRELFDGDGAVPPVGQSVVVINISVADPAAPFDGVLSSWARTLDWLAETYGVLVVVSAGNHRTLPTPQGADSVAQLSGQARADAVNTAVAETTPRRSLLAPADSINALSIGALNADAAGNVPLVGYVWDPADGELIVSPISAVGAGHHRSVKPDLIAPGGRVRFQEPVAGSGATQLNLAPQTVHGPGVRVAAPSGGEAFVVGTSPAAALVAREAARAVDAIAALATRSLSRPELAVATKAFVAHGARVPADLRVHAQLTPYAHGYGVVVDDLAAGCQANEATVLYLGKLGANEQSVLRLPLPNGLQSRGIKRITATLAWLSPVNWQHRQYRRAALNFSKPSGFTDLGTSVDTDAERSKRGTLQHTLWEVTRTVAAGQGSDLELTVQCAEQAGGLQGERADFAVMLTLWVAPELNVDVYTQVQQQITTPVAINP